uniref:Uncharacterized protein n=1 Tax=Cyprinus carpio TaxID=7962 RepID=A0A8C1KQG3_CYPCA
SHSAADKHTLIIHLPQLTDSMRAELDKPITEEEIWEAISKLKNNKSPEPGGNSNEFYKTFREIISPLLLNAVHTFLETGTLAPLWNDAAISLDAYKAFDRYKYYKQILTIGIRYGIQKNGISWTY